MCRSSTTDPGVKVLQHAGLDAKLAASPNNSGSPELGLAGDCCRAPKHQRRLRAGWFVWVQRTGIFWKLKRFLLMSLVLVVPAKSTAGCSSPSMGECIFFSKIVLRKR